MEVPNYTKFSQNHHLLPKFVSEFRYVASLRNSGSKTVAKFRTFNPVKLGGKMETLRRQVLLKYIWKWQNSAVSTDTSHISQRSSVVFICWWLWKEPVCRWWDEDADLECWRWVQILYARSDNHWQPQPCKQSSGWWSSPAPCWCVLVTDLPIYGLHAGRLLAHQSS